ncbi:hypothetical protein Tsubulata_029834 [Turnera subulata]|uniref:TPPC8 second Ig-like domain-containing protein n=1 Tax=Turnera subulata TaxID=218843 RepID=A0A9Q0FQ72_9ROSI|nr:hypothetical protein Tsubulata_029834 [Turnera subulata]
MLTCGNSCVCLMSLRDVVSDSSLFTLSEANFSLGGGETNLVHLMVTPKVEGTLRIVGVRWKLSGSVVGFYNFGSDLVKKQVPKGRRRGKSSPNNALKFIVIKNLPRLEGFIRTLPEKSYAGVLQHLVLELRNRSEFPVKNLRMKINDPRFLSVGNQEDLDVEVPACLEKKHNTEYRSAPSNPKEASNGIFLFPEDISVQGETSLLWPLWLRAAVPGNISVYVVLYYEMGDISGVMRYRTLRMHYNLQVLPSLDVSFKISPCPSRLQEFLVRMDVVNKTSSETFQVNQLSAVGCQWEVSLLQPVEAILSSHSLIAGQAMSCFFKLKVSVQEPPLLVDTFKNCRKSPSTGEKALDLSPSIGSDVKLAPEGGKEAVIDIHNSPLAAFHDSERSQDGVPSQVGNL